MTNLYIISSFTLKYYLICLQSYLKHTPAGRFFLLISLSLQRFSLNVAYAFAPSYFINVNSSSLICIDVLVPFLIDQASHSS